MSIRITMNQLHNIRDLCGMTTAEGKKIRRGKLIRSEHLAEADEADIRRLGALIDTAVDFRSETEHKENPDPEIEGVSNVSIPVLTGSQIGISHEAETDRRLLAAASKEPAPVREFIAGLYDTIAADDYAAGQYGAFVRLLLEPHERAVLWHCTAGKDRAGIAAVIVGEVLGIEREQLYEDYLLTNECLDIGRMAQRMNESLLSQFELTDEMMNILFGADRVYLDRFYSGIKKKYGSMEGYIRDGLKLTPAMIEQMKAIYLE